MAITFTPQGETNAALPAHFVTPFDRLRGASGHGFDRLRMYGSMALPIAAVVRFFALRAKKRTTRRR